MITNGSCCPTSELPAPTAPGLAFTAAQLALQALVLRARSYFTQTPSGGSWGYLNITSISGNTVTSTGTITVPDGTTLTPNPTTNWIIV